MNYLQNAESSESDGRYSPTSKHDEGMSQSLILFLTLGCNVDVIAGERFHSVLISCGGQRVAAGGRNT